MKQTFNPYLPSYEYVPDGEPHVFGDRVYVFGSHDLFDGKNFCLGDYVCWSADTNNLGEWKYEGVIYRKDQDKDNRHNRAMYAPDVCRGPDGRYYLYYSVNMSGTIGVACCDEPAGKYEFLGYVRYPDGTALGKKRGDIYQFDPAVYCDGEDTYLFSGFCPNPFSPTSWIVSGFKKISRNGPICVKLDRDMLTITEGPKHIGVPARVTEKGTGYEGHAFFEASSIRKIKDKFYFIYSSFLGHELCYAIGNRPDGPYEYGGTLVSIGDVGLRGIKGVKDAANFTGNTHGSILAVDDRYYIFYHRQTNGNCFSRQECAEEIYMDENGRFAQAEITSCGLNGGPLAGAGEYEARIACNLTCKEGGKFYLVMKDKKRPCFTQTGKDREDNPDQYITRVADGTAVGFKYFDLTKTTKVAVEVCGNFSGCVTVSSDSGDRVATIDIIPSSEYYYFESEMIPQNEKSALYFSFKGKGKLDFRKIRLS